MEEGGDGDGLIRVADTVGLLDAGTVQDIHQRVVDVEGVLAKTALVVTMVAGGGGGGEEVGILQIGEELIRTLAGDVGLIDVDEPLAVLGGLEGVGGEGGVGVGHGVGHGRLLSLMKNEE